jgi:hypothetical protein
LEADVLVRYICDNDLAGVYFIDEEFLNFTLSLVLLEISMDNQEIFVDVSLGFLDFLQENNHVRGCLDFYASTLT